MNRPIARTNRPGNRINADTAAETPEGEEPIQYPLRLSPIEICFLLEDRPDSPLQFFLRFQLSDRFDRNAFDHAFEMTLARHPLLNSIVVHEKTGWYWIKANSKSKVIWPDQSSSAGQHSPHTIDILREPGVRATVLENGDRSELLLQFHHAACDGIGASDFASDLFTAYANALTPNAPYRSKRLNPTALAKRRNGPGRWETVKWVARNLSLVWNLRRFYKRKPVDHLVAKHKSKNRKRRLAAFAETSKDAQRNNFADSLTHHFSKEESLSIQEAARSIGTTLNNLIIRHLLLTLRDTRQKYPGNQDDDWLRLTVPVNLRTAEDRKLSCANVVSLICIDQQVSQIKDEPSFQNSIDQILETAYQKHYQWLLPATLEWVQYFPNLLNRTMQRKRFYGTTLFSNIGPALPNCHLPRQEGKLVAANITIEKIEFLPAVRAHQQIAFSSCIYAGNLTMAAHYDPRQIRADLASDLFRQLNQRLLHTTSDRKMVKQTVSQKAA